MEIKLEVLLRNKNNLVTVKSNCAIRIASRDRKYASCVLTQMIDCIEVSDKELIIVIHEPYEPNVKKRVEYKIKGDCKELHHLYDRLRCLIEKNVFVVSEEEMDEEEFI